MITALLTQLPSAVLAAVVLTLDCHAVQVLDPTAMRSLAALLEELEQRGWWPEVLKHDQEGVGWESALFRPT